MKRPNLRKRGSVWYYDHGGKPRRWERLGTDEAVALARYEDRLYIQFVRHVADNGPPDLAEMARAILTTRDMKFARWCA